MEKIEYAILAGIVVVWMVALAVTLGVAIRQHFRRLSGSLDWS